MWHYAQSLKQYTHHLVWTRILAGWGNKGSEAKYSNVYGSNKSHPRTTLLILLSTSFYLPIRASTVFEVYYRFPCALFANVLFNDILISQNAKNFEEDDLFFQEDFPTLTDICLRKWRMSKPVHCACSTFRQEVVSPHKLHKVHLYLNNSHTVPIQDHISPQSYSLQMKSVLVVSILSKHHMSIPVLPQILHSCPLLRTPLHLESNGSSSICFNYRINYCVLSSYFQCQ